MIGNISIDTHALSGRSEQDSGLAQRDCDIALNDLRQDNHFQPCNDQNGPYDVTLKIVENRLLVALKNAKGNDLPSLVLSLKPYKRIIQDYFMIVHSYDAAMREGKPSRLEAIDMGRRGLHNEGAELLMDRLSGKIEMDHDTARRLFTLICVLHQSNAMIWRA